MPVTVRPSDHGSRSWAGRRYRLASSPDILLHYTLTDDTRTSPPRARQLIQSSFAGLERKDNVFATKNGFVHACVDAYNEHHCLVIRPEDVWFAILTQFSAYVNSHSDELRKRFCSHEAQQELHIDIDLDSVDHGKMAYAMMKLMQDNMRDESLQQWVLPTFTTTTKVDQAIASIIFMGTMQKYFTYSWGTRCGIPSVTLLGEESDWVKIRERAERLATFGSEPSRWLRLLRPILDGFIASFKDPDSDIVRRFWQGICNEHIPNGSGTTTYSGWITSFCFWDESGRCLHGPKLGQEVMLTRSQMPSGFTKVPVTLLDDGIEIPTEMVAGSMAMRAFRSKDAVYAGGRTPMRRSAGNDTVQPEMGWFMYKT
ncbi:uncharacterized protein F4822DRAFT_369852 [Hypoxylon trugodes]|uniref:uncharacterized protein n=1 Tax=Hypoxylon trugodes TaxID=326681 RepID=UPI0021908C13|nr:uncharacterized protein F4822DRAFT_369852 [Hypoxylon trugodes]KAI1384673.1 hypothetical protein F4822DRAFT_369852 [Hypoxylon trugodes]